MNITPIIRELLLHNQKAVIPGFGTFIITQRPAQLNKLTRVLTPPAKEIRFDRSQQSDDGQLSGYLIKNLKQKPDLASEAVNQFILSAEDQLKTKGLFELNSIGVLTLEKTSVFTFKPEEELLKQIHLLEPPALSIKVPQPETESFQGTGTNRGTPVLTPKRKRRWWIPAAIFALFIGLLTVGYFIGFFDRFMAGEKAGILTSDTKENNDKLVFGNRVAADSNQTETDTLKEQISREIDERNARENALLYEESRPKPPVKKEIIPSKPVQQVLKETNKPYQIIAGAFLVPNNAERLKLRLEGKGFSPIILPKRGDYYMISLGSFDTREQATAAMRQMRGSLEQELWVMKR